MYLISPSPRPHPRYISFQLSTLSRKPHYEASDACSVRLLSAKMSSRALRDDGALLLLPALSATSTRDAFKSAYIYGVSSALKNLDSSRPHSELVQRLDIALHVKDDHLSSTHMSRTSTFPIAQKVLEELYRLVCQVAAQEHVDLDFPGGVDARIFFIVESAVAGSPGEAERTIGSHSLTGPLLDLPTLTSSGREYSVIFAIESEAGESVLQNFIELFTSTKASPTIIRVPSGISLSSILPSHEQIEGADRSQTGHSSVAVGGTFDHLHVGHKLLLTATAYAADPLLPTAKSSAPRKLVIGISGDELLTKKKFADEVESWDVRQENTAKFLESILVFSSTSGLRKQEIIHEDGPNGHVVQVHFGKDLIIDYVQISDAFGPTITDETITALVLSEETASGGTAINEKRRSKGWAPLQVFEVNVLDATTDDANDASGADNSFAAKISSTEIRRRLHGTKTKS